MSDETKRCPLCDRVGCIGSQGPNAFWSGEQILDCQEHRVDWRARALDTEQSVANRIADWLDANGYLAPTQLIREGRWMEGR